MSSEIREEGREERMLAGSEIRRGGGEGNRPKGLQEKNVEDCSSYPFLLGKPTSC